MSTSTLPDSHRIALDAFSLAELESALAAKRTARLDALRTRRDAIVRELDAVEAELEAISARDARGARRSQTPADLDQAGEADDSASPRRGPRVGTMLLKALAASYPRQAAARELVAELRSRLQAGKRSPRPEVVVAQTLGRLRTSGLLDSIDGEHFMLTPRGLERAGAG